MKRILFALLSLLMISFGLAACQQNEKQPAAESRAGAEGQASASTPATKEGFTAKDKVVTISGKVLSYEDLQFYQLMNKVDIELNRSVDEKNLEGENLKEKLAYWDEQLKYHDNFNVNLSKMIEQHAMYLLAREEGLDVENAAVAKTVKDYTAKAAQNEAASQLISEFPTDAYKNRLNNYFTEKLLTQQIYDTLKADVIKEKPEAPEIEIAYDTSKNYEELYQSQIASLEIKINAAEKQ